MRSVSKSVVYHPRSECQSESGPVEIGDPRLVVPSFGHAVVIFDWQYT